jgi:hypothetical protein
MAKKLAQILPTVKRNLLEKSFFLIKYLIFFINCIGMGLVKFGRANEKVANAQLEYVSRVRDEFLFGLASSIEEFKQYQVR